MQLMPLPTDWPQEIRAERLEAASVDKNALNFTEVFRGWDNLGFNILDGTSKHV